MGRQRRGEKRGGKIKFLDKIRKLKRQGHFYRLTVTSEESAIRFHCCKVSRCAAAAERALGSSCAHKLALAQGGSQTRELSSPCSSNPQRQLPSERPAPSPWLEIPGLRYDSSFISLPHPHAAACPAHRLRGSARTPAPLALAPPRWDLASSPLAQPLALRYRCSFTAMLLFLFLAHYRAPLLSGKISRRRRVRQICPSWYLKARKGLKQIPLIRVWV